MKRNIFFQMRYSYKATIAVILILTFCAQSHAFGWRNIETGFVGVKYVWNEITPPLLVPGFNAYNKITTSIVEIETRPQTDEVVDVPCGTNDGVQVIIRKIEVGNQLDQKHVLKVVSQYGPDYDKYLVTDLVKAQITVICSKMSAQQVAIDQFDTIDDLLVKFIQDENDKKDTGLKIHFVRLTRPELPKALNDNYLALAQEKTLKKVLEEKKARIRTEKESEQIIADKDNEIRFRNNEMQNKILVQNMLAKQEEQKINSAIIIEAAKANAEKIMLEAKALSAMYGIPGYKEVEQAKALAVNQKIYYGEKLPVNYPLLNNNE
jgi:regulator of protease activity HflC (stomatin/prohibitin superfamily)